MATLPSKVIRPVLNRLAPQFDPGTGAEALGRFVRDRDETAFAHLVRRFGPLVMGVCRRTLGNRPDVDDAFQATFWVLARRAGSIRNAKTLPAWLHAVALRTARKALRRADPTGNPVAERHAADDPLADASWREVRQRLDEEVRRLPTKLRLPILLCYFEELTRDEAAARLGWSLSTLKRRLETARSRLRLRLSRRGIAPSLLGAATLLTDRLTAQVPAALESSATALVQHAPSAGIRALAASGPGIQIWLAAAVAVAGLGCGIVMLSGWGAPPASKDQPQKERPSAEKPKEAPAAEVLPDGALARFGTTRYRASTRFWFGSFSKDGRWFVSGTDGVELWDLETGVPRQIMPVRNNTVPRPRISPDGSLVAVLDGGPGIRVFDRATGKELWVGEKQSFGEFQFSPDSKRIVGITRDDRPLVKGYDARTGKEVISAWATGAGLDVWNDRNVFFVVGPGKEKALTVRVVDADGGKELKTFQTGITDYYQPKKPDSDEPFNTGIRIPDIMRYAVAPDLSHLAYQQGDATVAVVALTPGSKPRKVELTSGLRPTRLEFSADGKSLIASDLFNTIARSDVASGKLLGTYSGQHWHIDPAGKFLTTAGHDAQIHRWDLATNREIPLATGGFHKAVTATFIADGARLVVGDKMGTINVFDARTGQMVQEVPRWRDGTDWNTFTVSTDGRILVATRGDGKILWWDLVAGKELATGKIPGPVADQHYHSIGQMAFTPDGRRLLCSKHDATLFAIDTETRKELWSIGPPTDKDYDAAVGLSISADGRHAARGLRRGVRTGDWGYGLQIIDVATGRPVKIVDVSETRDKTGLPSLMDVRYTSDGRFIVLVSQNGRVQVRYADTLGVFSNWTTGSRYGISLGVSPDSRFVLTGDDAGAVQVWELLTGKMVASFRGHRGTVASVALSPDGRTVASGGYDQVAYTWTLKPAAISDRPLEDLSGDDAGQAWRAIWTLAADPDGPKKIRERFKPVVDPKPDVIKGWIGDLDDPMFARREAASKALSDAGLLIEPAVRNALAGKPTTEARERLEKVLKSIGRKPTKNDLVHSRAVHAMELADTEAARKVLEEWAGGVAGARLTVDAKLALERLRARRQ